MSAPTPEILLPCPFCGGRASPKDNRRMNDRHWYVSCDNPHCKVYWETKCDGINALGKRDAIRDANTRPAHPLSPAEAERIREALESLLLNYQQGHAACPDHQPDICMACRGREALALLEKAAGGQ